MAKKQEEVVEAVPKSAPQDVNEANVVGRGAHQSGPGPDDPDAVFDAGTNADEVSDQAGDPVKQPTFAGKPQKMPVESTFASRAKESAKGAKQVDSSKAENKAVRAADTK